MNKARLDYEERERRRIKKAVAKARAEAEERGEYVIKTNFVLWLENRMEILMSDYDSI